MDIQPRVDDRLRPDAHETHWRARHARTLMIANAIATTCVTLGRACGAAFAGLRCTLTLFVLRRLP